jgi:hypothetical protein
VTTPPNARERMQVPTNARKVIEALLRSQPMISLGHVDEVPSWVLKLALAQLDLQAAASEAVTDRMAGVVRAVLIGSSPVGAIWPSLATCRDALGAQGVSDALILAGSIKARLWSSGAEADDQPLPEDKAIDAAHPINDERNDELYEEALRLVGARRSKYGLVELVTWLLARERDAKSERDAFAVQSHARGQASLSTSAALAERSTLASRLAMGLEQSLALIGEAMQYEFGQKIDPEITPDGSVKGSDLEALLEEARAAGLLAPRPTG